jgi:uncharacterized membrane protein YfhO
MRNALAQGEKPRFDWRSVYAGLAIWLAAVLCWIPVLIYGNHHQGDDMGGWFITSLTIVISGVVFLGGAMSMVLGLFHFMWLRWRFSRSGY